MTRLKQTSMKLIAALLSFLCLSPLQAAQPIQQSSIDFLLSRPETMDVLSHAETWVYKSTTDNVTYTAFRYLSVWQNGGVQRYCIIFPQGSYTFPVVAPRFHRYVYFLTNGQSMDAQMLDWCIG